MRARKLTSWNRFSPSCATIRATVLSLSCVLSVWSSGRVVECGGLENVSEEVGLSVFNRDAQDFIERRHLPFTNQALRLLLKLNLVGLLCDNLGLSPVILNHACHADLFVLKPGFRVAELVAVASPNQNRENLVRIWLVKIQKGGIPFGPSGVVSADHLATYRDRLANVVLRL